MTQEQKELLQRILDHHIAGEQYEVFLNKLIKEQDWSRDYCEAAVDEYKRFVFLACVSKTPVTPSHAIDEVWHCHMLFSRDYWKLFCPEVLGRELHHDPSGDEDAALMEQQFRYTLKLYKEHFNEVPPTSIWLGECSRESNIPSLKKRHVAGGVVLVSAAGFAMAESGGGAGNGWTLEEILISIFIILFIGYLIKLIFFKNNRKNNSSGSSCSSGGGCSSCSSGGGSSCGGGGD